MVARRGKFFEERVIALLTPDDIRSLKPQFEEVNQHLNAALAESEPDVSEEALGHYIAAVAIMEDLVEDVAKKQGHSVKEALKRVMGAANSAEGAGAVGGIGSAAAALSFTGLGGFGLVAGGTGIGVAGLAGAGVATGGAALAGAAALYLGYKAGAAALETELGQKAVGQAAAASKTTAERARSVRRNATEGLKRVRNRRGKNGTEGDDQSPE